MALFYTLGVYNPTTGKSHRAINAGSPKRGIAHPIAMTTAMVVNDQIIVGKVPSHAILLPESTILHPNLGASVTIDVGFLEQGPAVLGSALAMSAAGTKAGLAAVAQADLGKAAWQLAGYSSDPRGELTIAITVKGANVGTAGNVFVHFAYQSGT